MCNENGNNDNDEVDDKSRTAMSARISFLCHKTKTQVLCSGLSTNHSVICNFPSRSLLGYMFVSESPVEGVIRTKIYDL
jgi:hypothetical protein